VIVFRILFKSARLKPGRFFYGHFRKVAIDESASCTTIAGWATHVVAEFKKKGS
jgi:hypothetical protein